LSEVKQKIIFIINPISGVGRQKKVEKLIEEHLDCSFFDYIIVYTETQYHAVEICKKAATEKIPFVVIVGGDGTVNEAAKGLIGSETTLGIIPTGSGNGLAHHLNIPLNIADAIEIINYHKTTKIDTASINGKMFVSIAGVGFDALVAHEFAKSKKRGFWSYLRVAVREYILYKPKRYKIIADGKTIICKALLISFANSDQFGYNASIAPKAIIDDGYIDICIFKKVPVFMAPYLASMMFIKKIDETTFMNIIKVKEARIISRKIKVVHIDGDPFEMSRELLLKVNPLSLKIIVPKSI